MACKGQHCAQSLGTHSQFLIPPGWGRGGRRACSQGLMVLPGPASRLLHCPDPSSALSGLTPCWAGPASTHPCPPLASVHHGLEHLQEQLVHGDLALQLHSIEMGQHFARCLAKEW